MRNKEIIICALCRKKRTEVGSEVFLAGKTGHICSACAKHVAVLMKDVEAVCSLCGKKDKDVSEEIFLEGKMGFICGGCAGHVGIVMEKEGVSKRKAKPIFSVDWTRFRPRETKAFLDEFVIGQDKAKEVLSVAFYNHYKRLSQRASQGEGKVENKEKMVEMEKSNIILVGETGVGKTYLLKTIARKLQVPFCIADATVYTQAGYHGGNLDDILVRLLQAADFDVPLAERGIVYLDEFDKIAARNSELSMTHDMGKGVQQALLKMVEGSLVNITKESGKGDADQKPILIDTSKILFICGGSFDGLEDIIKNRLEVSTIGFQRGSASTLFPEAEKLFRYTTGQDLRNFGIIPELVGRLPVIVHLDGLTRDMLRKIFTTPKNALIKQYQALFAMESVVLTFTDEAIDCMVDRVFKQKVGARGLRNVVERVLLKAMFELPGKEGVKTFSIDKKYVLEQLALSCPKSRNLKTNFEARVDG